MLLTECPACRTPLHWTYIFRTLWSRWRCVHCGSLLRLDMIRRPLGAFLGMIVILAGSIVLTRNGWPPRGRSLLTAFTSADPGRRAPGAGQSALAE